MESKAVWDSVIFIRLEWIRVPGDWQVDERQIGLTLALSELGVSSDVSEFSSRLILQKTVYLIEEAGIKLGI